MVEDESESSAAVVYRRLNKKCMISMYINNAIVYVVLLVAYLLLLNYVPALSEPSFDLFRLAAIAALALILVYMLAAPAVYYQRYRYMITEDKVDVRYGIIVLRHILVPIERVHQVQVSRGPVNNLLGLAHVNITTAGGTASISYLELDEAEKIAEKLNQLISAMLKDRERT